jgi:hypothetical protein
MESLSHDAFACAVWFDHNACCLLVVLELSALAGIAVLYAKFSQRMQSLNKLEHLLTSQLARLEQLLTSQHFKACHHNASPGVESQKFREIPSGRDLFSEDPYTRVTPDEALRLLEITSSSIRCDPEAARITRSPEVCCQLPRTLSGGVRPISRTLSGVSSSIRCDPEAARITRSPEVYQLPRALSGGVRPISRTLSGVRPISSQQQEAHNWQQQQQQQPCKSIKPVAVSSGSAFWASAVQRAMSAKQANAAVKMRQSPETKSGSSVSPRCRKKEGIDALPNFGL